MELTHKKLVAGIVMALAGIAGRSACAQDVSPGESPGLQQLAVAYYANKYRTEPEEALRRITIQDRAAGIENDLVRLLDNHYAGIWYDHADRGRLKIGMTRGAETHADEVRSLVEHYGLSAETDLVPVQFGVSDLEKKQHAVRDEIGELIGSAHALTSYNTRLNKVVVTAIAALPPNEEARLKPLSTIPWVYLRRVEVPTLASVPVSCNVTYCNPPLRGGREMHSSNGFRCTIAFIARDRFIFQQYWAITAGHCIFASGDTKWNARDESGNESLFGNTAFYTFAGGPGADAGIVSIDLWRSWATPLPIPAVVVKGSAQTAYDPNYAIRATAFSSLGQILCRTGRTTGTECGEVSNLGADETESYNGVNYQLRNMGELDVCGAADGDSGGPLYKNSRAFGLLSASINAGPTYCFTTYQGIHGAENLMGVSVLLSP